MNHLYLLLIFGCFFTLSCTQLEENEALPAYMYIESLEFETTDPSQGTDAQDLPHVWINVGGDFVGTWEMPALIPLNYEGNFECRFQPGMIINGISTLPEINEAMDPYIVDVELVRGEIDTIRPVIRYDSTTVFKLMNDFDRSTHDFREDLDGNPFTSISITDDAFEGKAGVIRITEDNPIALVTHRLDFTDIPLNSNQKFLELHYKNDVPFELGIRSYDETGSPDDEYFVGLNPTNQWKKAYIEYTDIISFFEADRMRVVIGAVLQEGQQEGTIRLDNIKFYHEN
ncbi:MAG TPA: hypothetical protein VJ917_07425 [Saprospiraceae bacterium]|nr:hypothetical protein [Saprospiraceae bacterium]